MFEWTLVWWQVLLSCPGVKGCEPITVCSCCRCCCHCHGCHCHSCCRCCCHCRRCCCYCKPSPPSFPCECLFPWRLCGLTWSYNLSVKSHVAWIKPQYEVSSHATARPLTPNQFQPPTPHPAVASGLQWLVVMCLYSSLLNKMSIQDSVAEPWLCSGTKLPKDTSRTNTVVKF